MPISGCNNEATDLIRQCDRADLREAQVKLAFEQRIDGDDQRLHHIVEEVREAERAQQFETRRQRGAGRFYG